MPNSDLLRCRIFGHAWDEVPVGAVIDSYTTPLSHKIVIALQCMRCKTARIDSWNRWGALGGRKYIYPDDYKSLNEDLREHHKAEDTSWIEAKKRYLKARAKDQTPALRVVKEEAG
jgi:hypothetical protein